MSLHSNLMTTDTHKQHFNWPTELQSEWKYSHSAAELWTHYGYFCFWLSLWSCVSYI